MNDLCAACGMCCNGAVFRAVPITPGEIERLRVTPIVTSTGKTRLRQPCELHTGDSCRQYDARPAICRSYSCKTLTRLVNNELTFEQSLALVRRAIEQYESLVELMRDAGWTRPGETGGDAWWRLLELAKKDDPADRRKHGALLLMAIAYHQTVERWF
jgi:hypothetical protein